MDKFHGVLGIILILGIAFGVAVQLFAIGIGLNQVFLALPAGRFVDRHGLKKPVGLAVLLAILLISALAS